MWDIKLGILATAKTDFIILIEAVASFHGRTKGNNCNVYSDLLPKIVYTSLILPFFKINTKYIVLVYQTPHENNFVCLAATGFAPRHY